jgi:DNA helicase HerA-like ATPase
MVFFFDEAHLLFSDAPRALMEKIEQVVRLVRSKGVGVYFISQNPLDIPDIVLGQLGNRVQHALRAFTPRDQKAVKSAAETFRPNPKLNVEREITELGVGEALISFLEEKGTPGIVQRAFVAPPSAQIGAITPEQRQQIVRGSVVYGHYEKAVDRESAYELLKARTQQAAAPPLPPPAQPYPGDQTAQPQAPRGRQPQTVMDAMVKSAARAIGSQMGRQIIRGVLGSIFGGTRR